MSQMNRIATTSESNIDATTLLAGAAAGALLMYLLDPDRGSARRARSVAAVRGIGSRTTDTLGNVWHGASGRAAAWADEARDKVSDLADKARPDTVRGDTADRAASALSRLGKAAGDALDDTLARAKDLAHRAGDALADGKDRAGNALERASSRFGSAADEAADEAARSARRLGRDVRDAGRETGRRASGRRAARAAERAYGYPGENGWGAAKRNAALAAGGLMAVAGLLRRSPLGFALGFAGAALLARGVANKPLGSVLAGRGLSAPLEQPVDFEASIHIDAAPEEVYDLWTNYENFPRFMSNVVEVRDLGRRRSHWVVRGPGGSEFAWNSVLTKQSRPHRLAWRSEPGAEIPQSGSIHLEAARGGTDVVVRMSYTPPAGMLGHGLASLLGADPKARMEDDLARMKAYLERGAVSRDAAAQSRPASRFLH